MYSIHTLHTELYVNQQPDHRLIFHSIKMERKHFKKNLRMTGIVVYRKKEKQKHKVYKIYNLYILLPTYTKTK